MTRKSPRRYAKRGAKPEAPASPLVRLQKVLAESGIASRRHSEAIIKEGRVSVDGHVVTELGTKVDPHVQKIEVDGKAVQPEHKAYYMVNKPEGFLCTNDDPEGRDRVIDLLPKTRERLYPVGRLDEASQGLMLVTNDGPLANRLLHPRYGVPKVYRVQVAGNPEREALDQMRTGQEFSDGTFHVEAYKVTKTQGDSTFLEIVLKEGHNREIRRLFARIGHKVLKLQRIAFGPLRLGTLKLGSYRHLTTFEVRQLKDVAAGQKPTGEVPLESAGKTVPDSNPQKRTRFSSPRKPRS